MKNRSPLKKHPFIRPLYYDRIPSISDEFPKYEIETMQGMKNKEMRQLGRNNMLIKATEEGKYTPSFIFNHNGSAVQIPVPDISLVYLRLAYMNFKVLDEAKSNLIGANKANQVDMETAYHYFGAATIGIVNIFACIEAFCNQIIPQHIQYQTKKKGILGYSEVVMEPTVEKIKYVLPFCFKKSLKKIDENAFFCLTDMVKVRDRVIHMKYDGKIDDQVELFERLLQFDYSRLYNSAVRLLNLYKPDYVVECSCPVEY